MKVEKLPLKSMIKNGIISGLIFSIGNAFYDFFTNEPFDILKFILNFLIFGITFGAIFRFKYTKEDNK